MGNKPSAKKKAKGGEGGKKTKNGKNDTGEELSNGPAGSSPKSNGSNNKDSPRKKKDKNNKDNNNNNKDNNSSSTKESKGGNKKKDQQQSSADDDGGDIDPSWNEPVLYQGNTFNSKVTTQDFELLHVIGKGSFGKVMQVKKRDDGKIYAMKVLRKDAIIARKQVAHTRAEKTILQKIQHPFIVKLHYAFQTDTKLYMILDYINGGELFSHLKREGRFSEERVRLYAAEIVLVLAHLHSLDIVYRDLKPENILVNSDGTTYFYFYFSYLYIYLALIKLISF